MVVDPEIPTESGRGLRQGAIDLRLGVGGNAGDGSNEGVAPGGRAVPHILRGRVVVERQTVDEIRHAHGRERAVIGKAQVGIVDADRIGRRAPRELDEGAQIVGDFARVEEAQGLGELRRVLLRHIGRGGVRNRLGERRVRRLKLQRERCRFGQRQRRLAIDADVLNLAHIAEDIAVELEEPPKGRELGKDGMAGFAGDAGLAGKAGRRVGGAWREEERGNDDGQQKRMRAPLPHAGHRRCHDSPHERRPASQCHQPEHRAGRHGRKLKRYSF
jgi:hypothetical protein